MSASNPKLCVLGEADIRQALEKAGWRYTRQRSSVFSFLQAVASHPTAEQVFAGVRTEMPRISLATVYKALEALVDAGLAARIAHDSGAARYDARSEAHYHLRCEQTGEVRDLSLDYDPHLIEKIAPQLVEALKREGFEVTGHRLEVLGRFVE